MKTAPLLALFACLMAASALQSAPAAAACAPGITSHSLQRPGPPKPPKPKPPKPKPPKPSPSDSGFIRIS